MACENYQNTYCTVNDAADMASCECVSGASPVGDDSGNCAYDDDNSCSGNADCEDPLLPVCNDASACSNPCDATSCNANETCTLDDALLPFCDCTTGFYRSDNGSCILNGTCGNNGDCNEDVPLCQAAQCVDPCENACDANEDCTLLTDLSIECECAAGFEDPDEDGTCTLACTDTPCAENASCYNLGGTPTCICDMGFTGDGSSCTDIDGCENNPCDDNEVCIDIPAPSSGHLCECASGYQSSDNSDCVLAECPSNAEGAPNCQCQEDLGYYGELILVASQWQGECEAQTCEFGQHVQDHTCESCPDGEYNAGGEITTAEDTDCVACLESAIVMRRFPFA